MTTPSPPAQPDTRPVVSLEALQAFRAVVLDHYRTSGRELPWRRTRDPYAILVSEVMLQQTQVPRVLPKYAEFLTAFPTAPDLARAAIAEVLSLWQGLGYNRRALALHRAARIIVDQHSGVVPVTPAVLQRLPGIGPATSAAVCVFAFDAPLPFIETNIRAAFIHFFFQECVSVSDSDILPLVESTLDRENPRDWYYALMDYGAWVKRHHHNPSRRSRHHSLQSPFIGSRRQLRASVLRLLLSAAPSRLTAPEVHSLCPLAGVTPADVGTVLEELAGEGFLGRTEESYEVA